MRESKSVLIRYGVLVLFSLTVIHAQSIEQLDGMPSGIGARAVALGNSYVAETYDAMAMYWNPAAIVFVQRSSLVDNAAMGPSNELFREDFALPVRIGNEMAVSVGLQGSYFGQRWSNPSAAFHSLDLAFAGKVSPTVSFGALLNTRYSSIYNSSLWTASGTLGAFYFPAPGISYGLAFKGLGWGTNFALQNSLPVIEYQKNLPKSLQIGATIKFPSYYENPDITLSAADEKILGENLSVYRAGFEYQATRFLALRCGIVRYSAATVLSAGFGITTGRLELDYSYAEDEFLVQNHFFSISYLFNPSF